MIQGKTGNNKYLIISTVGDKSLHSEWIAGPRNFDVFLLYYGNNEEKEALFVKEAEYFGIDRGVSKFIKIKKLVEDNRELIEKYRFVWLPDDDISLSSDAINRLFAIADEKNLQLCQPAMTGYVSHGITRPQQGSLIRYTSFVEVLAPLFRTDVLLKLSNTFDLNKSSWGLEYLWVYHLGYPLKGVAIIDSVVMEHTRPVGTDYSRFGVNPEAEMLAILAPYKQRMRLGRLYFNLRTANIKNIFSMISGYFNQKFRR